MTPQGYQRLDGHRCERLTDDDPAGEHISVEIIGEYADNKRVRECYVMRYYNDWRCVLTYYPDQGRACFQHCSVLSRVFLEHTSLILAFGVTPALR